MFVIIKNVFQQFKRHQCLQQAASLTFTTLLSLVPLSAVALFLLNTFGVVNNENSPIIATLNNYLPSYRADEIVSGISEFTNRNLTGLGVGGFLLFLVISLLLFISIEDHFNHIWGSPRRLPLIRAFQKYLVFYMLLLIGPLVVWLIFSQVRNVLVSNLFPWISVYFLFFVMYIAFPNTSVNWISGLIGSLVSGTLFQIARSVFAYYFESVWQNYTAIYGAFAMLIIFAIWNYATWIVILFGVEVSNAIQRSVFTKKRYGKFLNDHSELINSPGIISLFLIVAEHFNKGKGACSTSDVATTAKVSETLVQQIFECFKTANLLYEVEGDTKGYIPVRSLDTITLDSLIVSVDDELTKHFTEELNASPELTKVFTDLQESQVDKLKDITVSSILDAKG
ncbi:MAG: YihY family inner membrane protein [Candidatus Poribacteria bacterium]|nr:YihY family inner membrane protein [Candidatus Poribacteria bacterium]